MQKFPMTPSGFEKLKNELVLLKNEDRPKVIADIQSARELGDLSENAEYHAAKEKQGFIEGRISELESKLSRAEVIDITKIQGEDIKFGATATILDLNDNKEITYKIVGADESDIARGLISFTSPIARGLIGKKVGAELTIETPGGKKSYEVLNVEYK